MERSGFVFYRSFRAAAARLPDAERLAFFDAVLDYGLDGKEPDGGGVVSAMFELVRPQIDANNRRRENGLRPKANRSNPKQTEAKESELKQTEAKDKDKDKDKDKVSALADNAQARVREKISFTDGKFSNISDEQIATWREAYPAVDVNGEILRAAAWLSANPKNTKSDYKRFLNNWLSRSQDHAPRVPVKVDANEEFQKEWERSMNGYL